MKSLEASAQLTEQERWTCGAVESGMELLGRSRHQPLSVEFVSEASTRSFSWNFQTCVYSRWQSNNLRHWVRTVLHTAGLPMWLEISASYWFEKCFRWANFSPEFLKLFAISHQRLDRTSDLIHGKASSSTTTTMSPRAVWSATCISWP